MFRIHLYCFGIHGLCTCLAGGFQSKTAVCGLSMCPLIEGEENRVREEDDERDVNIEMMLMEQRGFEPNRSASKCLVPRQNTQVLKQNSQQTGKNRQRKNL